MAKNIKLTSGSILNGNPITFSVEPMVVSKRDTSGNVIYPSFHRIVFEVKCGMNDNNIGSYEIIKMSSPVEKEQDGTTVQIDVSSALRTFRDSYEYTPNAVTYPFVSFNIKAYDEYMLDGELKTGMESVYYPSEDTYLRTIFGAFSDFERMEAGVSKDVISLSKKPTFTPQLVAVGETFAYTLPYSSAQNLANSDKLEAPSSLITDITQAGYQSVGGQQLYATPASDADTRCVFRFINSFGVLESISVPKSYSQKLSVTTNNYVMARQETFNTFSRAAVKKKNNKESWLFVSDPLDENWLRWYLHEFLMSEHVWIGIENHWIPCTVTTEDETTIVDHTNTNMYSVSFTAQLDINGSPIL